MNASVTNQVMPKNCLETLATISMMKYFGHIMHSSDSMKKRFDIKSDKWQRKIQKTVNKMIRRNIRNPDEELVQDQEKYQEP